MEVDDAMVVANDEKEVVNCEGTDENDNNGVESKSVSRKINLKGSGNCVESVEAMETSSTPNGEVKGVAKEVSNEEEERMQVEQSSVSVEGNGNLEEDKENLEKGIKSAERSVDEENKVCETEESSNHSQVVSQNPTEVAKAETETKEKISETETKKKISETETKKKISETNVKIKVEKSITDEEKKDEGKAAKDEKMNEEGKDQTIIITETKSLAKAINDAVKKPDGKPTLVIIESKTGSSSSGNTPPTPTTPGGSKASKAPPASPSTGMTLRSRNRPATTPTTPPPSSSVKAGHKSTGTPKTDSDRVALKDDAEINIYTPSLMVPYIYETSPREKLHDFLSKIGALTKKVDQEDKVKEKAKVKEIEKGKAEEKEKTEDKEKVEEKEKTEEKEKGKDELSKETEKKVEGEPAEPKKEKTFFDTALGLFFVDIGLLQAQRYVQAEVLKSEKRKLDKGWSSKERKSLVARIGKTLEDIDKQVKPYQFKMKMCKRCDFKTESQTVLERHLETIHVIANKMVCSYCDYFTLEPTQIFEHLNSAHKRFGRLERPLALHQCPMCPVEDSAKARVTRHMWKCAKNFVPDKNQAPSNDFEPPAKRMRHLATVGTLKAMRAGMVVDKMSSAAALNPTHLYQLQQQQNRGAPRAQPPPIRPKPGDIRLSPAYVQSVLRGQYMSSPNVRGMTPNLVSASLMRQRNPSAGGGGGAYMLRQSNPVVTSINTLNNPLQASQLFQVINPSTAGGLVPLVGSGRIGGLNAAQRFTILPTPPVSMNNNRGPTPVALIPNLVTNSKSASSLPTNLTFSQLQSRSGASQGLTNTLVKGGTQKPNISITPVNKLGITSGGGAAANTNRLNAPNKSSTSGFSGGTAGNRLSNQNAAQANQSQNAQGGQSGGGYVVCEICDGYIKDLDQLRNHMQWIHKVKIHPKMIHNRPPLNCQKCHFRFFTDQGLERHLLGSHGLVTSSMQENANKGKDGGRCIICGKVFLWKLVVHMAKDHKMTLKPAHLSYKCTVCSATFNMYRLFETHVYDEHSTVAKRVLDGQKGGGASNQMVAKAKVNTTPASNQVQQRTQAATSGGGGRMGGPAASSTPRPATSRITLHPEPRVCDDCGVTFKRGGNCDRHWEPTKLKPCNANLCRVDKCDACLQKTATNNKAAAVSALIAAAAAAAKTPSVAVKTQQKVAAAAANGKTEKVSGPPVVVLEKVSNKNKETKVPPAKQPQQSPSDGEDVFDMEVETVDENGSSARSDVESD